MINSLPISIPKAVPTVRLTQAMLLLAALLVIAIGLYTAVLMARQPFVGIRYLLTGEIVEVIPNSPAWKAGIRLGDHLVALDDIPVGTQNGEVAAVGVGESTTATIIREDQRLEIALVTEPQPMSERGLHIALLLIAAAFWVIGVAAILRYFSLQAAPHFAIFCLAGAAALVVLTPAEWSYEWARAGMYIALSLTGAAFLNVNARFPFRSSMRWPYRLAEGAYLITAVIAVLTIFIGPVQLTQWSSPLGIAVLPGRVVRGFFFLCVAVSILLLGSTYRNAWAQDRQRIRIVFYGTLIGMLPITFVILAESFGLFIVPPLVAASVVILLPMTYTFALNRFGLAQRELHIFQILVMCVTLVVLVGVYFSLVSVLMRVFPTANPLVLGGAVALVSHLFVASIQHPMENTLRRLFFMEERVVDPHLVLSNILQKLTLALGDPFTGANRQRELFSIIAQFLLDDLRVESSAVWMVQQERLDKIGGDIEFLTEPESQNKVEALVKTLIASKTEIEQPPDAALFTSKPVRYWIPLVIGEQLLGIWAIGIRHRDEPFSIAQQTMLEVVARGTSLALNLAQAYDRLQWMNLRLSELRESEQTRFASDVHDGIVGPLYAVMTSLGTVAKQLERGSTSQAQTQLETITEQVRVLTTNARDLCYELRPDVASKLNLDIALQTLCERSDRLAPSTTIAYGAKGPVGDIQVSNRVFTALYRGAQEAITNALKHSGAPQVRVALEASADYVAVTITDNGVGFDYHRITPGLGLATTRDRVTKVGGQRFLNSKPGIGTCVTFAVPIAVVEGAT